MTDSMLVSRISAVQRIAAMSGIAGVFVCIIAAFFTRDKAFQAYWFAWVFWAGVAFGALSLLMLVFLTRGAWGDAVQQPVEAAATTLPLIALLLLPAFLGMEDIFEWARPGAWAEHHSPHKQAYLTVPWFGVRSIGYFVVTLGILAALGYLGPGKGPKGYYAYRGGISGAGMLVYAGCMLFASTDWVMSLQPGWYSTMFGVIFMSSGFLAALALVIGVTTIIARQSHEDILGMKHFYDLGNLLLAFVIFWTYVSYSQFMLIWYGNLPQEITWYLRRRSGGWEFLALALVVFQFAVPFMLLLFRAMKRHPARLGAIAWMVFVATALNAYWLVVPAFRRNVLDAVWLNAAAFTGLGGIWIATFLWLLKQRWILPREASRSEVLHG